MTTTKYFLSPFFKLKSILTKQYAEHIHSKLIVIIPEDTYENLSRLKRNLFGFTLTDLSLDESSDIFKLLKKSQILVSEDEGYSELTNFFVRPRNNLFGLPYANAFEVRNSITIMGVPLTSGNPNQNNLASSVQLARNYSNKYSINPTSLQRSKEIKGLYYKFPEKSRTFDLGDFYFHKRENLTTVSLRISEYTSQVLERGNLLIALGGDHSISYPLIMGVKKVYPAIVCIHIDAHNDIFLQSECHFSDLFPSHSSVISKMIYNNIEVHSIGLRDFVNIESFNLEGTNHYNFNFSNGGSDFETQLKELLDHLKGRDVYLTVDIDVLDPKEFSSVTDPLPFGLSLESLVYGIETIFESVKVRALDIVEANLSADSVNDISVYSEFLLKVIEIGNSHHNE